MKAIVCRQPGGLAVEDRPDPVPAPGELLVRIRRVGICGTDYHIYEGLHPYLEYPRVMGHELAASVVEAPGGHRLRPGQAVVVNPYLTCGACAACRRGRPNCCMRIAVLGVHRDGGMCDYLCIPDSNLYPAGVLSLDAAAAVEFLAIGAHAVRRAGIVPGTRTLVAGAGPIGLGAAIFARIAGAPVTLLDHDAQRLALAGPIAAAETTILADSTAAQAIADITQGDGFEVVIDATGNRLSMERGFDHVAHGGIYVLISVVREHIAFSDPEFHKREMTLMGSRNAGHDDFRHVMASIIAGKVPIAKLMTHRTSLAGAVHDLPRWAHAKDGLVKALIDLDEITAGSD
jgi:2-desacetyl-2-hydroxyethyl bacteriochlorophyllide A dehydrogenase